MGIKKISVLLSGAGGSGTIAIIQALKSYGNYRVAAVDADKCAVGLYLADYGKVVPLVKHKDYFKCLARIIRQQNIDIYIPLIDEELMPAYDFVNQFDALKLILPRREFASLVLNKYAMALAFQRAKILCPTTYGPQDVGKCKFAQRMIVKPIYGRGSEGVAVVQSRKDFNKYFQQHPFKPSEVIVQKYIGGTEYTVSAVVGHTGFIYSVVPKRIIKKKGITYSSITEKSPLIERVAERIQKTFHANGPFNIQLKIHLGKVYVFEVNPRFSTTVAHTIAAGVDEIDCLIKDRLGMIKHKRRIHFQDRLTMLRYLSQYYIKESPLR